MDTKRGGKKSAASGRLIKVLDLQQKVPRASPVVAAHVAGDLNVLGDIPSNSFGYSKKWHCTNDSEFLSLINSKSPLPRQRSWQGFRLSFLLITKVISELGKSHFRWDSGSDLGEWGKVLEVMACILQTPRN